MIGSCAMRRLSRFSRSNVLVSGRRIGETGSSAESYHWPISADEVIESLDGDGIDAYIDDVLAVLRIVVCSKACVRESARSACM